MAVTDKPAENVTLLAGLVAVLAARYLHVTLDPTTVTTILAPALTPHAVTALVNFFTARGAAKVAAAEALKVEAKAIFDVAVAAEVEIVLKKLTAPNAGGERATITVAT